EPVLPWFTHRDRLDLVREHSAVPYAAHVVGELRTRAPFAMAEHVAETIPEAIVRGAERDVSVGAPNRLIRRVHAMCGPQCSRYAAAGEIFGRLPHRQRDAGVDERRVDLLSPARALAVVQRGENAGDREEPRAQIGERHARLPRRSAGLARD